MAAPKKKPATARKAKTKPVRAARRSLPKGYTSPAWERVSLLAVELAALAHDLGQTDRTAETEGFDVADAARELGRLATNHDRSTTPTDRTTEQETEDWIAVGGLGADLGNMADEGPDSATAA